MLTMPWVAAMLHHQLAFLFLKQLVPLLFQGASFFRRLPDQAHQGDIPRQQASFSYSRRCF